MKGAPVDRALPTIAQVSRVLRSIISDAHDQITIEHSPRDLLDHDRMYH